MKAITVRDLNGKIFAVIDEDLPKFAALGILLEQLPTEQYRCGEDTIDLEHGTRYQTAFLTDRDGVIQRTVVDAVWVRQHLERIT